LIRRGNVNRYPVGNPVTFFLVTGQGHGSKMFLTASGTDVNQNPYTHFLVRDLSFF
jgi:hypothetical protein